MLDPVQPGEEFGDRHVELRRNVFVQVALLTQVDLDELIY